MPMILKNTRSCVASIRSLNAFIVAVSGTMPIIATAEAKGATVVAVATTAGGVTMGRGTTEEPTTRVPDMSRIVPAMIPLVANDPTSVATSMATVAKAVSAMVNIAGMDFARVVAGHSIEIPETIE